MIFRALLISATLLCSQAIAFEFDMTNPVTVTKISNEWGIKFQYDKVRMISCKEISNEITITEKRSEQAVELYKKNGVDLFKEISYDFSTLNYELISQNDATAKVYINGTYDVSIPGKFDKSFKMDRNVTLKKVEGLYYFCGGSKR